LIAAIASKEAAWQPILLDSAAAKLTEQSKKIVQRNRGACAWRTFYSPRIVSRNDIARAMRNLHARYCTIAYYFGCSFSAAELMQ
jgi:hypothetical protein